RLGRRPGAARSPPPRGGSRPPAAARVHWRAPLRRLPAGSCDHKRLIAGASRTPTLSLTRSRTLTRSHVPSLFLSYERKSATVTGGRGGERERKGEYEKANEYEKSNEYEYEKENEKK